MRLWAVDGLMCLSTKARTLAINVGILQLYKTFYSLEKTIRMIRVPKEKGPSPYVLLPYILYLSPTLATIFHCTN